MSPLKKYLHDKYGKPSKQVPPIRIRGFNRHHLFDIVNNFELKKGAEIGVAEGRFSEFICKKIDGIELLSVDNWEVGDDHRSHAIGQKKADERYEEAKIRLAPFNCKVIKSESIKYVHNVPKESLDFVYIDACHEFDYVMEDLINWARRVKKGGLIALHDYYHFKHSGVVEAVDIYTRMHQIYEWFITDERTPSAFWVKE